MDNNLLDIDLVAKRVRKAVFPVAGLGTRFLPATKANPKEMMPVVDKPLIQYAVEEAVASGITELIFVTSSSKRAIEDHFDTNYELEAKLQVRGENDLLDILNKVLPKGISCIYVRQPEALGLGHAIYCAKHVIGNEPFAVLLADDLILSGKDERGCLAQLMHRFQETRESIIAVEKISKERTEKYGMVGFNDPFNSKFSRISEIIEKPKSKDSPSLFAVVGRYILTPTIFSKIGKVMPGKNGEIQLTDAISNLLLDESVHALEFSGKRFDCGTKLGYLQAIVEFGLKHNEVGIAFKEYLNTKIPNFETSDLV